MRKKDGSLYGRLLTCAGDILAEGGPDALTMRALAKRAGVAGGTLYNYFQSKEDILLALTAESWEEVLQGLPEAVGPGDFLGRLGRAYSLLRGHLNATAGALMHSLQGAGPAGRQRMQGMQAGLRDILVRWMQEDDALGACWDDGFTHDRFADFIILNLTAQLRADAGDIEFLLEVVRRALYG